MDIYIYRAKICNEENNNNDALYITLRRQNVIYSASLFFFFLLMNMKRIIHELLEMISGKKLRCFQVFERHGLVQENPLGQKFDPNKHDAIFQVQ
jgi:hypothetical protein